MDALIYNGKEQMKFSIGDTDFECLCTWEIKADKHELIIIVNEENNYFDISKLNCDESFSPEYLYLTSCMGEKISLFQCLVTTIEFANDTIILTYNFMVVGNHVRDIFNDNCKLCKSLRYTIESTPISLVSYIPYKREQFDYNGNIIEINIERNGLSNVDVEITAVTENISFNQITRFFYEIVDVMFLCLGFYPYTICEQITLFDDSNVLLFHRNKNKHEKGASLSHWTNILVSPEDINYVDSVVKFDNMFGEHNIVIEVLTNAIYTSDLFSDLKLSLIIQCVEGYMTKWHDIDKFDNSIKEKVRNYLYDCMKSSDLDVPHELLHNITNSINNMLGNINKQSFSERINAAFDLNDFTSVIIAHEKTQKLYDDFLNKSKLIRNQFAHMNSKKNVFHNEELYIAMEKYILLLRVLILSDLSITIDKQNLETRIADINKLYKQNTE